MGRVHGEGCRGGCMGWVHGEGGPTLASGTSARRTSEESVTVSEPEPQRPEWRDARASRPAVEGQLDFETCASDGRRATAESATAESATAESAMGIANVEGHAAAFAAAP